MGKNKSTAGPMKMQPDERSSIRSTPAQPMMPVPGIKAKKMPQPSQKSARAEAVRFAKANITRRNSLRKQREALKS
jgi:hypothetical protein